MIQKTAKKNLFQEPRTRIESIRQRASEREHRFGPVLDAMDSAELATLCRYIFPAWPRAFGRIIFTPETARQDKVLRRLLLAALETSR